MKNCSLLLLLLSMASLAFAACKDPVDVCGCPPRKTFDLQYLQTNQPDLLAKHSADYDFSAPTVSYPDCKAIITECPESGAVIMALVDGETDFNTKLNGESITNPFSITNIRCSTMGQWWIQGVGSMQAQLDSYRLGCLIPK